MAGFADDDESQQKRITLIFRLKMSTDPLTANNFAPAGRVPDNHVEFTLYFLNIEKFSQSDTGLASFPIAKQKISK